MLNRIKQRNQPPQPNQPQHKDKRLSIAAAGLAALLALSPAGCKKGETQQGQAHAETTPAQTQVVEGNQQLQVAMTQTDNEQGEIVIETEEELRQYLREQCFTSKETKGKAVIILPDEIGQAVQKNPDLQEFLKQQHCKLVSSKDTGYRLEPTKDRDAKKDPEYQKRHQEFVKRKKEHYPSKRQPAPPAPGETPDDEEFWKIAQKATIEARTEIQKEAEQVWKELAEEQKELEEKLKRIEKLREENKQLKVENKRLEEENKRIEQEIADIRKTNKIIKELNALLEKGLSNPKILQEEIPSILKDIQENLDNKAFTPRIKRKIARSLDTIKVFVDKQTQAKIAAIVNQLIGQTTQTAQVQS